MRFLTKYILVLLPALFLCGCGFQPLYVEKKHDNMWYYGGDFDTSISDEMAKISIEPIADRFGQVLRNNLLDLLTPKGSPKEPKYRLFASLASKRETDQALRSDITATRKMVVYKVSYYMTEDGRQVMKGDSVAYTSYDILANPYSTTIARKKATNMRRILLPTTLLCGSGRIFTTRCRKR